jgi:hypothetical protein
MRQYNGIVFTDGSFRHSYFCSEQIVLCQLLTASQNVPNRLDSMMRQYNGIVRLDIYDENCGIALTKPMAHKLFFHQNIIDQPIKPK